MVGDSCLLSPLRCSLPGDRVRGLMGAGRRRGELLDRRREAPMEGLLSDDCSWQLLRDAWMDGLLREDDRPAGTAKDGRKNTEPAPTGAEEQAALGAQPAAQNTGPYCAAVTGGTGQEEGEEKSQLLGVRNRAEAPRGRPDARPS